MQIIKQIFLEAFFDRKQHKVQIARDMSIFVFFFMFAISIQAPHFCFFSLLVYVNFNKRNKAKEKMPEIVNFVPMMQKNMQQFVTWKANIVAAGSVLLLLMAYIYIVMGNDIYVCDALFWEFVIYHILSIYLYADLLMLIHEIARWRKIDADVYMQWKGSVKHYLAYAVFLSTFVVLVLWCGSGAFRYIEDNEPAVVSGIERVIVIALLVLQCVMYHYLKKKVLKDYIYGDYNAAITNSQEVDYEY